MERNNGSNRYTPIRRAGQQQHPSNSLSSSLSSSNNNQHNQPSDNHRNNSSQYSTSNHSTYSPQSSVSREPPTQHDELIRYIREAWTKVNEQNTPINYCQESDHQLKNFKPFNLEEYWDQRHFQNIRVSHGQQ
ncbi:PREDICTED: protein FAM195A isoform X2 [Rhagoletis zephyria]|uniref:protein FAM195A isoform X2 n=1 Tax=Rhagoletis zephyria TaxID=28612 RepID=UPI0008117610|nr:PREDICTED: protein FAM195A isoform X2 [Rhagoletis zephyria]